jgi:hypothetical protein
VTKSRTAPESLTVCDRHPLIGVEVEEDGPQATRYFTDEAAADAALTDEGTQAALAAIGAWADLNWREAVRDLDRIRHESELTTPIGE